MAYPYRKIIKPRLGTPIVKGHRLGPVGGLLGCWLFNEGSGNKVFDLSGNGFHGIEQQDSVWQAGKYGPCRYFSGNDYIDCGDPASFFSSELTVIVSFKVALANGGRIVSWGLYNNADSAFAFRKDAATTNIRFSVKQNTRTLSAAPADEWTTLAISYKQNVWGRLYQNGARLSQDLTGFADAIPTGTYNLRIGVEGGGGSFFTGQVSHVLLYNRALLGSEIALLYQHPWSMFKDPAEIALLGGYQAIVGMAGAMTTNTGYWGW